MDKGAVQNHSPDGVITQGANLNSTGFSQLIVYACPLGELAQQLDLYFDHSLQLCGRNAAHHYMPHCTLTGFFEDDDAAIAIYQRAIALALEQTPLPSDPVITVTEMTFRSDWHGLELQSHWLQHFIQNFAQLAVSPTRPHPLRLKDWLHLSLAYEFSPAHADTLTQLAQTHINPRSPVQWEVRFYQRHSDHTWTCHQTWSIANRS